MSDMSDHGRLSDVLDKAIDKTTDSVLSIKEIATKILLAILHTLIEIKHDLARRKP
jgi:hypothetical protein